MADTHRQRYHVPVTLKTSGEARALPPDAALALLRTAQEAMINAAKHAPGQRVAIRLDYGDNERAAQRRQRPRRDPCPGPGEVAGPPGPGSTGGYGLTGMRERLRLLNGTLLAGGAGRPTPGPPGEMSGR